MGFRKASPAVRLRWVSRTGPCPSGGSGMIRSMTGYGSAELERDGQRLAAEIRSVNHRFCEVSIRAPKLVSLFEDQVRQLIQDRFSRGKFNLAITWSGAGEAGEDVTGDVTAGRPR